MSEPSGLVGPDADESTTLGKLAAALAKAQGAMEAAKLDAQNSGYGKRYATLSSVWEACRGPLSANGLAVVQRVGGDERRIIITTDLIHGESGEFMRSRVVVPAETDGRRNMAQAVGTSISYLRRYSLAAMVWIAQEDDDAESAGKAAPKRDRQDPPAGESVGASPANFPNFGKWKGAPISGAPVEALEFHLSAARKSLADPDKAKYHAKESALIGAIEAELKRQSGAVPQKADEAPKTVVATPPPKKPMIDVAEGESEDHAKQRTAGVFYAQAVKVGKDQGWEQADVGKWLKDNRKRGGKSEVTEEDVRLFVAHFGPPAEPGATG